MKTTIEIDDQLIAQALKLSNIKDKNIVIDNALRLYVTVENPRRLLNLWKKIDFKNTR